MSVFSSFFRLFSSLRNEEHVVLGWSEMQCFFLFLFFLKFSFVLCSWREIQVALPSLGIAAVRVALPTPTTVFMRPNNGMAASVRDFYDVDACIWFKKFFIQDKIKIQRIVMCSSTSCSL